MSVELYHETLKICQRHADRLIWSMQQLQPHIPFSANTLQGLNDIDLAIMDQFSTRFSKLQDVMGEKLFPTVLELSKEQEFLEIPFSYFYRQIASLGKNWRN